MRLILCFGVVCHLMSILKKDITNLLHGKLVSRYISYVDKDNSLLKSDKDTSDDIKIKELNAGNGHNSKEISKIMTGDALFQLSDSAIIEKINILEAATLFRIEASSWFTENNKCLLMLSLLDILQNDKFINGDGSASFSKFIDKNSSVYYFPEFMIRILLYSAHNDIDEKAEKDCVKKVSQSINENFNPNDKRKYSIDEPNILTSYIKKVNKKYIKGTDYNWDPKEQKLTILDSTKFQAHGTKKAECNGALNCCQNENPSENNCNENSIAPEETSASKVDEFTEGNLISEEMREQITKEPFSDTENKSNSKLQKKSKKEANVPDIYKICRFCKRFKPDTNNDSEEGDCSVYDKKVRMDQIGCKNYKHSMKAIIDYEMHLPPGEGHM